MKCYDCAYIIVYVYLYKYSQNVYVYYSWADIYIVRLLISNPSFNVVCREHQFSINMLVSKLY